ncbi:tRNA lysidine(34) synthetase TilS [Arthrobacter sp. UM1]|uniref:tRNA lysidine(34) synthetase TilS n=1 Tax=Arthrobacter sp. UM1 TaxID=2766776 RepID=UPI001CF6AF8B|nr:tRNA lysidine(34) synthetase TilS [Arthrobacter sp. UM1]MCB4208904.1 tRNA lysidine(34) synthetase TilS [Arthrobacter sp. UM1]
MSRPDPVFLRALSCVHRVLAELRRGQGAGLCPDLGAEPGAAETRQDARGGRPRDAAEPPRVLAAVSGGADSLALASALAFAQRKGAVRARAGIVDHGLQPGSAEAAERARASCERLGLPASVLRVRVPSDDDGGARPGLEAAARTARYTALAELAGTDPVLTAHTLSDQSEQVLLGLARGSGTRSLAGIPRWGAWGAVRIARPFLDPEDGLWREDTERLCEAQELPFWQDPSNLVPDRPRTAVRIEALPALELAFPGVRKNLARTAALAAEDADFLDRAAEEAAERALIEGESGGPGVVVLSVPALREMHPAMRSRVLLAAARRAAGPDAPEAITRERVAAAARLALPREEGGTDSAGPVQLPGVRVWRKRIPDLSGKMGLAVVFERA